MYPQLQDPHPQVWSPVTTPTGIMETTEFCGFEDVHLGCWFEYQGLQPREEAQMQFFAEEIMPVLQKECGGSAELPTTTLDLRPGRQQDTDLVPVGETR